LGDEYIKIGKDEGYFCRLGANAVIGLDMETSDILQGTVLISATGTAVVIEPE